MRGTMIGVAPAQAKAVDADLPSVGRSKPPERDIGLPAPAGQRSIPIDDSFGEIDLPVAASAGTFGTVEPAFGELPAVPAPRVKPPVPAPSDLDLPLPAPRAKPSAAAPPDLDLPLPAARGKADVPAALDLDLPLPAARGKADVPASLDFDLPLAAPPSLPAPRGVSASLPAPLSAPASLPAPRQAPSLPAPKQGLADLGLDFPPLNLEMDLPSPGQDIGLPSPARGADLPVPSRNSDLPSSLRVQNLPAARPGTPVSNRPAPVFGQIDLPGGSDLPSFRPSPGAANADPFADFGGAADPVGDEMDLGGGRKSGAPAHAVRGAGGSVAYGEVSLGESDGAPLAAGDALGESAEFDLPQEAGAPASLPAGKGKERARPAPGTTVEAKKRRVWIGAALVAVVGIGGGALTLVPDAGPFGAYFVMDLVHRNDHRQLLASKKASARTALGLDTYQEAARAIADVQAGARSAVRFKPLAGYAAFVGFARLLRFGTESGPDAQAKVGLDELAQAQGVMELDLARATRAVVDGDIPRARSLIAALAGAAQDPDVAILRGEIELRAKDAAAATAAFSSAASLEKSARATFGLARAAALAGDGKRAEALAIQVLTANPQHVGARLLVAEAAWVARGDEAAASKVVSDILAAPDAAGPEERIFARTLLGEIHLARGRMTQAEDAFSEAIRLAEAIKLGARAARALSDLGETLFRAGRFSQASARYRAAAQADPEATTALVGVAKSSFMLERVDEAKDILNRLRKAQPNDFRVAYWSGRVVETTGDRAQAETLYKEAITLGQGAADSVDAYISLATALSADGSADAANAALADAQARLPASSALFKALGRVAMAQGRYADGLSAFDRALELDKDDVEGKFLSGTALVRLREFEKATAAFDDVAKIDKDFPGLALERGILYQESGRTEDALREYEGALAKAPNDPDLLLKVGCGKASAGGGEAAEQLLHKVLEQRPNSAEPHFCLGRSLMARNDLADALKEFERAVQIDPNRAEYYLYVGWVCNESGSLAKATTALKRALELDQGLADAYWQRGVLRLRQTRPKDAVDDLNKALSLRPSRAEAHADLALAYYDLGKEDVALAEWQQAIKMNPNEASWHFHFGKLLNLRLQNAAAVEQLEKAISLVPESTAPPAWLSEAHRIAAVCLGASRAAIPHWQAFLRLGPQSSPFRNEAKQALQRLGAPADD